MWSISSFAAGKECIRLTPNKLNFYMAVQRISKKRLSDMTGLSTNMISSYAKGTALPNVLNAIAIANALRCSVHDLWGEPDPEEIYPKPGIYRNVWSTIPKNEGG